MKGDRMADVLVTECADEEGYDVLSTVGDQLEVREVSKWKNEGCSKCYTCEEVFQNPTEYKEHVKVCGTKDKYCGVCNASFKRLDHLNRHIRSIHSKQRTFICPVCSEDCKRQFVLINHMKKKHENNTIPFKCQDCEFTSLSLSDLLVHEDKHFYVARHSCPHCDVTFKRRDHMLRHMRAQHLNKVIKCDLCSAMYRRRDHLTRHIREKHSYSFQQTNKS